MRFVAALDTIIFGVEYQQGAEVDTTGWTRKMLLQFLQLGIIQAAYLTAGAISDRIIFQGDGVTTTVNGEGKIVVDIDPQAPPVPDYADLGDVDMTGLDDGDVPVWDASPGVWRPGTPAGGGGGGWTEVLNLPLTTMTGWTVGTGAWTASAAGMRQSNTAAGYSRVAHTASLHRQGALVVEAEIRADVMPSTSVSRAGILIGTPMLANAGGAYFVVLRSASAGLVTHAYWERDAELAGPNIPLTTSIALGTWIKLRIVKYGSDIEAFINDVYLGTAVIPMSARPLSAIGLYCYQADATFRNLKTWVPALPA